MIAVCSVNAAARRYAGGGFVLYGLRKNAVRGARRAKRWAKRWRPAKKIKPDGSYIIRRRARPVCIKFVFKELPFGYAPYTLLPAASMATTAGKSSTSIL